ncbi:putative nuclease HARBI1 isoform X2 [Tanacetum coccineum]
MNQNRTVFDIDEETDAFYLQKAVEYHEWLIQQEAQPRLTRTPIFRDREDAERRLRADYFDDHYVERAFGVLQGRWGLIQQPARAYEVNTLRRIMSMQTMWIDRCETQRRKTKELRDRDTHISLQQNLMNHIWREVEEASEED